MKLSNEEKATLMNQNVQHNSQDKLSRMSSDSYYGQENYSSSRRVRQHGYGTNGEYWEE